MADIIEFLHGNATCALISNAWPTFVVCAFCFRRKQYIMFLLRFIFTTENTRMGFSLMYCTMSHNCQFLLRNSDIWKIVCYFNWVELKICAVRAFFAIDIEMKYLNIVFHCFLWKQFNMYVNGLTLNILVFLVTKVKRLATLF